jgi:hypothetical protein
MGGWDFGHRIRASLRDAALLFDRYPPVNWRASVSGPYGTWDSWVGSQKTMESKKPLGV